MLKKFFLNFLVIILFVASASAANFTIRGTDSAAPLQDGDSFIIQRNDTGDYFHVEAEDIQSYVFTGALANLPDPPNAISYHDKLWGLQDGESADSYIKVGQIVDYAFSSNWPNAWGVDNEFSAFTIELIATSSQIKFGTSFPNVLTLQASASGSDKTVNIANASGTLLIDSGAVPLTADWDAGAWDITMERLNLSASTSQITLDSGNSVKTIIQDSATSSTKTITTPNATTTLAGTANFAQTFAGTITLSNSLTLNGSLFNKLGASTTYGGWGAFAFAKYTNTGNVGAGEDTLHTYALPKEAFDKDGASIIATYQFTIDGSATETSQIKLYFGTASSETLVYDSGAISSASDAFITVRTTTMRSRSDMARVSVAAEISDDTVVMNKSAYVEVTSLNWGGNNNLLVTGESAGASPANNDVVLNMARGDWAPGS